MEEFKIITEEDVHYISDEINQVKQILRMQRILIDSLSMVKDLQTKIRISEEFLENYFYQIQTMEKMLENAITRVFKIYYE